MTEAIWITRSLPAAYKSAEQWALMGCKAGVAPLLHISPPPQMPRPPEKDVILVFTSGNGIAAFADLTDDRHWPVITVGDESARLAREARFKAVSSAKGTSEDVTKLIIEKLPKNRPIIHCAGKHVRGSIVEDLNAAGFIARRDLYYHSTPIRQFPNIDLSSLTYIALYSPIAAKTLAGFSPNLTDITIISISAATDEALGNLKCAARLIAKQPTESAMLSLIEQRRTG